MHVAYIHQYFSTRDDASGTRSYEMSRRLIEAGHRVTMICGLSERKKDRGTGSERVSEYEFEGIQVKQIREDYANRMGFYRRLLAFGRFARTASDLVAKLDADLVFATSTPLSVGIPGMKGARRLGVPFVFEVRDLWPELPIAMGIIRNPLLKWYTRRLEHKIYHAATRIFALAPGIKEGIERTGYPPERISTIPNCCDLDLFRPDGGQPLDDAFGDDDEFRLVFTGAHGLANGLDAVLDAAGVLKRRGARGIRFVFIGGGREKDRLIRRSRDEGIDDYVLWLPPMPKSKLAGILPHMDVGLMVLKNIPAFYYGTSPNKFFDYIACGLPVLNNYPGWLADIIREHELGEVVPPDDPEAFAEAICRLRERRHELPQIGARSRALAEAQFSRDEMGRRFISGLEQARADWSSSSTPARFGA